MSRIVHTNFYPNPLKLIYNLNFLGQKKPFFFGTLKSIQKIKNCKKGLSSSYLATIYYMYAKLHIRLTISFHSARYYGYNAHVPRPVFQAESDFRG